MALPRRLFHPGKTAGDLGELAGLDQLQRLDKIQALAFEVKMTENKNATLSGLGGV